MFGVEKGKEGLQECWEGERWDGVPAWSPPHPFFSSTQMYYKQTNVLNTDVLQTNNINSLGVNTFFAEYFCESIFRRFSSSDYWFNQMYYGTHGPFKRAEGGQAITFENDKVITITITFENDKVHNFIPLSPSMLWKLPGFIFSTSEFQLQGLWSLE